MIFKNGKQPGLSAGIKSRKVNPALNHFIESPAGFEVPVRPADETG